jgi:hypothetical protein
LQLCHGQWLCDQYIIEQPNAPAYARQVSKFRFLSAGLRIDPMDLEKLKQNASRLMSTPRLLAQWVADYCRQPQNITDEKEKVLAHSLLYAGLLYTSDISAKNLVTKYHAQLSDLLHQDLPNPLKNNPLNALMTTNLSVFKAYVFCRMSEYQKEDKYIQQLWSQRHSWSTDRALLFTKTCLRLLTEWCQTLVILSGTTGQIQESTLLALATHHSTNGYFVNAVLAVRRLLLQLKYQLGHVVSPVTLSTLVELEPYLDYVINPVIAQYHEFAQLNVARLQDPLCDLLLTQQQDRELQTHQHNNVTQMMQLLSEPEKLVAWLRRHQANRDDYSRFYSAFAQKGREKLLNQYIDVLIRLNEQPELVQSWMHIPDLLGYRQSERLAYQQLGHDLLAMTQASPEDRHLTACLTWFDDAGTRHERFLTRGVIDQIIDKTNLNIS